ncbi:MAG: helix-turn-helix transcriptional regulator [Ferruginibacter sp.]|nr:helix-turn-helix transcriptional regulator [Ferruginibacter sp.]
MIELEHILPSAQLPTAKDLIEEKERKMPGTVQYSFQRFRKSRECNFDDVGLLSYYFSPEASQSNRIELKFCIAGNIYCSHPGATCSNCMIHPSKNCSEKIESIDFLSFSFPPAFLQHFSSNGTKVNHPNFLEKVLRFKHKNSFTRTLPLCGKIRNVLEPLLNHNFTDALENVFVNAQIQVLFLYSLDCMLKPKDEQEFTCKFLASEESRASIARAREILIDRISEPITIRDLSKMVAINECYLKKGFKIIFGTTIFDFYQSQRMEHAKYLLYEKGMSVTDVSSILGYSSISHFSTAFKKFTGIKPCELLLR